MSLSEFHEVGLPLAVGLGASGGPEWRTEVLVLASGGEVRNARWARSRRRWDIASAALSLNELAVLTDFFEARKGRLHGFRFRDPADQSSALPGTSISATDQTLGIGDGETAGFQLVKAYGDELRPVLKPVGASVLVASDGVDLTSGWSVDSMTGLVTFDLPPAAGTVITAGFHFDWPVRFDSDHLDLIRDTAGSGRGVSIPIIELR